MGVFLHGTRYPFQGEGFCAARVAAPRVRRLKTYHGTSVLRLNAASRAASSRPRRCVNAAFLKPTSCIRAAFNMARPAISPDALERFRNAAAQFAGNAAPRASRLLILKDDIAALRKRGVSYRAIAELLTQNGIAASDTCVIRFCHRVLKEKPPRKPAAARHVAPAANHPAAPASAPDAAAKVAPAVAPTVSSDVAPAPVENTPFKSRGPRIAKIEFVKPDEQI